MGLPISGLDFNTEETARRCGNTRLYFRRRGEIFQTFYPSLKYIGGTNSTRSNIGDTRPTTEQKSHHTGTTTRKLPNDHRQTNRKKPPDMRPTVTKEEKALGSYEKK